MGHATFEWIYVGVVIALLIYVGAASWDVERFLDHAPAEAQVVKVTGQQWFWTFEHEDGTREIGELHLTKGVPYRFEITSRDVNHAFNIPDLVVMMDAVPGRINQMWVMPDVAGEYLIQCREYCGFSHYQMRAKLIVEEPEGEVTNASATSDLEQYVPVSATTAAINTAAVS
jgi:cytochrome c oxidase subunit 2